MGDSFYETVLISGEFKGSTSNAKYSDNESRGSVAVFFTLFFIQFFAQTNFQKIIFIVTEPTEDEYIGSKKHKRSIYVKIKQLKCILGVNKVSSGHC